MSRWVCSSVVALVLLGCTSEQEYLCEGTSMCVVGAVVGQCQSTGFCSFPDTGCPSGQRYGEFAGAGLAFDCVPADPTAAEAGSGGGASSSTTGPESTTQETSAESSASSVTTGVSGQTGPLSGSGETSSASMSGGTTDVSSGSSSTESDSASESGPIEAPPCADYNFESSVEAGIVLPDLTTLEDDFPQSCLAGNHVDAVFYWVAPVAGTYEFYVGVDPSLGIDVIGALWDGCDGAELVCDDDGGDVIDSRIVVDASAGEAFLWVVNAYGTGVTGFEVSISPI